MYMTATQAQVDQDVMNKLTKLKCTYRHDIYFFHRFPNFSACIKQGINDPDGVLHARMINVLSHGNWLLFKPMQILEENKRYFINILGDFMANCRFGPELFPAADQVTV